VKPIILSPSTLRSLSNGTEGTITINNTNSLIKIDDVFTPALNIPNIDNKYCADIFGSIWSKMRGSWRSITGSFNQKYLETALKIDGKYPNRYIHRLVAAAYHGTPDIKYTFVRHIDKDILNNAPFNLKWYKVPLKYNYESFQLKVISIDDESCKLVRI